MKGASVNGVAAQATRDNFAEWEVDLSVNVVKTPQVVAVGR